MVEENGPDVLSISIKSKYIVYTTKSLLLPVSTSYLCESKFFTLKNIKCDYDIDGEMIMYLSRVCVDKILTETYFAKIVWSLKRNLLFN